jgi:hypothetical protein
MSDRAADPDQESEQPGRGRGAKHGHRLLKVAALGGAVALLLNEDVRGHLLDALFGAEEEFDYSSMTEPPTPATPPDGSSPTEPWVRPVAHAAPPDVAAPAKPDANGEAPNALVADAASPRSESAARGTASISPSPAAWRAAAAEDEPDRARPAKQTLAGDGDSATGPPGLPADWWSPSAGSTDPLDG